MHRSICYYIHSFMCLSEGDADGCINQHYILRLLSQDGYYKDNGYI